jgi:S1-C subfamily serine protease
MMINRRQILWLCGLACFLFSVSRAFATEPTGLPDSINKIKPSIVAIGTYQKTRRPPSVFRGTGFVIGDGRQIATNAHVLPDKLDREKNEILAVFSASANEVEIRQASKIAEDRDYDLAILAISGPPLTAVTLGDSDRVKEGRTYAFTGFPIGMVLGLHPVTHRGIISAITPIVIPQLSAQQLEKKTLARLIAPYDIFQLDATAYPGNSGSPLYQIADARVIGILNKVFVQQSKETLIQQPSGISYAIPIKHLLELMKKIGKE